MEGKVIIWANYVHDIKEITNTLENEYGEGSVVQYYGEVSSQDRQEAIKQFQDSKSNVKYFVGNTQTAGYGLTLTAASNVIYYSNNYDLEKRLQSEDRAHRIGQHKPVTYVDLIAEKTVDEKILKALKKKINIASIVMGDTVQDWI
jgi:SNF2 family DNA or RNA helicase